MNNCMKPIFFPCFPILCKQNSLMHKQNNVRLAPSELPRSNSIWSTSYSINLNLAETASEANPYQNTAKAVSVKKFTLPWVFPHLFSAFWSFWQWVEFTSLGPPNVLAAEPGGFSRDLTHQDWNPESKRSTTMNFCLFEQIVRWNPLFIRQTSLQPISITSGLACQKWNLKRERREFIEPPPTFRVMIPP